MNAARHVPPVIDVDLGNAPPMLSAGPGALPDRHRVSLRWLTGTVLASIASTFLMGGALYAAFDGRETIAQPSAEVKLSPVDEATINSVDIVLKSDLPAVDLSAAQGRQILKVSTIVKDGERDIVRLKPFAKVSSPLITDIAAITDPIPKFDPLRIFADANASTGAEAQLYGAAIDSDMTIKVSDFPVADPSLVADIPYDVPRTERIVREAARFLGGTNAKLASLSPSYESRFDFGFAEQNAFDRLGVRIIPENVSFVAPTMNDAGPARESAYEDRKITVTDDEPLDQLLTDNEATDDEAGDIVLAFHKAERLRVLKAGDEVRLRLAPDPDDDTSRYRPILVSIYRGGQHFGSVGLSDDDKYIPVNEPPPSEEIAAPGSDENSPHPRLYESLYETALSNDVPPDLIDELVRIYSFDLDLNARVQPGDNFQVVYTMGDGDGDGDTADNRGEIVYTAITLNGKERRFYRYRAPDDGTVDYYDADGKSAKKFLIRKPVANGVFRSAFGARNHPLLGVVKMHTGVDWAAPRGTPIMAAGDGIVTYAKWKNGYGNFIQIQHTNGYSTCYAHQTAFAKGIHNGSVVKQGQIIGYVGTTGLSTGPHLHFEIRVNGTPVDPMRIKLPRGRSLDGTVLASFEKERERVDTLLAGGQATKVGAAQSSSNGG